MPKRIKSSPRPRSRVATDAADSGSAPTSAIVDLSTTESLARAGFSADAEVQARFLSRINQALYGTLEFTTRPAVMPVSAAIACGAGAAARGAVGDAASATAAALAGLGHAAFAAYSLWRSSKRRQAEGPPDDRAAFDDGELKPRLEEGESLLRWVAIPKRRKALSGALAGLFQVFWGFLLGGLPLALGGAYQGSGGLAATTLATLLGTAIVGRGIRILTTTRSIRALVLTDRRVVAIAAPGAARSLYLNELRHRPVLVARGEGRATLALEVRPQETVAPLPLMGLWGIDDLPEAEGEAWASAVMDARRELLSETK